MILPSLRPTVRLSFHQNPSVEEIDFIPDTQENNAMQGAIKKKGAGLKQEKKGVDLSKN